MATIDQNLIKMESPLELKHAAQIIENQNITNTFYDRFKN